MVTVSSMQSICRRLLGHGKRPDLDVAAVGALVATAHPALDDFDAFIPPTKPAARVVIARGAAELPVPFHRVELADVTGADLVGGPSSRHGRSGGAVGARHSCARGERNCHGMTEGALLATLLETRLPEGAVQTHGTWDQRRTWRHPGRDAHRTTRNGAVAVLLKLWADGDPGALAKAVALDPACLERLFRGKRASLRTPDLVGRVVTEVVLRAMRGATTPAARVAELDAAGTLVKRLLKTQCGHDPQAMQRTLTLLAEHIAPRIAGSAPARALAFGVLLGGAYKLSASEGHSRHRRDETIRAFVTAFWAIGGIFCPPAAAALVAAHVIWSHAAEMPRAMPFDALVTRIRATIKLAMDDSGYSPRAVALFDTAIHANGVF